MTYRTQRTAFTLIEIVIVLIIVSIILLASQNIFRANTNTTTTAKCLDESFVAIQDFFYSAINNKSVYSGEESIFPEQYTIVFSGADQIRLGYDQYSGTNIYNCDTGTSISGAASLRIQNNGMTADTFTGFVQFIYTETEYEKIIGAIRWDTRKQSIGKYICKDNDNSNFCSNT